MMKKKEQSAPLPMLKILFLMLCGYTSALAGAIMLFTDIDDRVSYIAFGVAGMFFSIVLGICFSNKEDECLEKAFSKFCEEQYGSLYDKHP